MYRDAQPPHRTAPRARAARRASLACAARLGTTRRPCLEPCARPNNHPQPHPPATINPTQMKMLCRALGLATMVIATSAIPATTLDHQVDDMMKTTTSGSKKCFIECTKKGLPVDVCKKKCAQLPSH